MFSNPWNRMCFHPKVLAALACAALLLFIPSEFTRQTLVGDTVVTLAKWIFPIINAYGNLSSNSAHIEIFLSVMFLGTPLMFLWIHRNFPALGFEELMRDLWPSWTRNRKLEATVKVSGLLVILVGGIFGTAQDPSFCSGCTSDNRLGLLLITFYGLLLLGATARIAIWFIQDFRKTQRKEN